jgi:hypothetical protein
MKGKIKSIFAHMREDALEAIAFVEEIETLS